MFFFRAWFWLTVLKVLALAFVGWMITLQIPELQYDLGPKAPASITSPDQLTRERFPHATFVAIEGTPSFENAFIYRRYGLEYTYFNVEPYGLRLVARTYDEVTDEWKQLHRFVGKLRPFERQPFSYRIREIYEERNDVEIPQDAFFLALYDVPEVSGWQIGAVIFASVLWLVMLYLFFIHRWKKRPAERKGEWKDSAGEMADSAPSA